MPQYLPKSTFNTIAASEKQHKRRVAIETKQTINTKQMALLESVVDTADTSAGLDGFLPTLSAQHLEPLWLQMEAMVPPEPNPLARPHLWSYENVLPQLLQAAKLVPAEQAERRVLMLVNPAMSE